MNWGKGIAIFLTIFVLFIAGLVYMTTQSTFHLQADDYYKQEIAYQGRIDALAQGRPYAEGVGITWDGSDVLVTADSPAAAALTGAKVHFMRPNDSGMDREFDLIFEEGRQALDGAEFAKGVYEVLITAESEEGDLAIKKDFVIR